jgi:hypothetical protein
MRVSYSRDCLGCSQSVVGGVSRFSFLASRFSFGQVGWKGTSRSRSRPRVVEDWMGLPRISSGQAGMPVVFGSPRPHSACCGAAPKQRRIHGCAPLENRAH